jgi:glycerol-3-phosphate O-acyltransferase/dihydroxyacetone phosphate acyltransferase
MTFTPKVRLHLHFYTRPFQFPVFQDNPELLAPVHHDEIKAVTARMQEQISSRTIDAPSWDVVRSAKMATRIYAPLGTHMSLGDYVRVTRTFVEAFKTSDDTQTSKRSAEDQSFDFTKEDAEFIQLRHDLKVIEFF